MFHFFPYKNWQQWSERKYAKGAHNSEESGSLAGKERWEKVEDHFQPPSCTLFRDLNLLTALS